MIKRRRWYIVLAVGALLVLFAVGTVAYLLRPPRQTSDVAVPPPDATPEHVVTAYIEAMNAHDCDTAESLMVVGAKDTATEWCTDVANLTDVKIHDHFMEPPKDSGRTASDEVVNVPVTFNLHWRPLHDDGSMEEGRTTWGYLLVRGSEASPWRIFDQGTG